MTLDAARRVEAELIRMQAESCVPLTMGSVLQKLAMTLPAADEKEETASPFPRRLVAS